MLRKNVLFAVGLGLLGALVAIAAPAAQSPIQDDTVVWELTQTRVVAAGQTGILPADPETGFPGGTMITDCTLEAKAKAKSGYLVPEGTFQLTFSAFRPKADMPPQKAGLWYVQGQWTIVDKHADSRSLQARHNPFTVTGRIHAALPFNPARGQGKWSAGVTVPMALIAGQWARGSEGSLTFDDKLEGDLYLALKLWSANQ
jgi:hypothetical protein